MRIAFDMLIFLLCCNLSAWYLNERAVMPTVGVNVPIVPQTIISTYNATQDTVGLSVWAGSGILTNYWAPTLAGLQLIMRFFIGFVVGLPMFLYDLGCPAPIQWIIVAVSSIIWSLFVVEFFTGRSISSPTQ